MKVIVVFKRLLASGNDQHGRHLFKWGYPLECSWLQFTKRDALSSVCKIYMHGNNYYVYFTTFYVTH